jgi:hypothetical protein
MKPKPSETILATAFNTRNLTILIALCLLIMFSLTFNYIPLQQFQNNGMFNLTNPLFTNSTRLSSQAKTEITGELFISSKKQYNVTLNGQAYPKVLPSFHSQTLNFTYLNKVQANRTKLIVLWNTWYSWVDWKYGLGKRTPFENNKCPVTNCELTYDRTRLNQTDLVVFDGLSLKSKDQVPVHVRNDRTRLVLFMNEAPRIAPGLPWSQFNGLFDLVVYYKRDSDFAPFYYADNEYEWSDEPKSLKDVALSLPKSEKNNVKKKFAAAMISNCNRKYTNRLDLIDAMQKHVQVDLYGKCGIDCMIPDENRLLLNLDFREIAVLKSSFLTLFHII